jgi:hypothetical protein
VYPYKKSHLSYPLKGNTMKTNTKRKRKKKNNNSMMRKNMTKSSHTNKKMRLKKYKISIKIIRKMVCLHKSSFHCHIKMSVRSSP